MKHSLRHQHHKAAYTNLNAAFKLGIALNVAYVAVEAAFGFAYNSMGLLSDAGHNLSDVATLSIALIAYRMSQRPTTKRYTYGYRKMTVQASLANAVLLLAAAGVILIESISKLIHPEAVDGDVIAWVAGIGVVINGVTAWLFMRDKDKDLNVKGVFLHMAADALVSIGVVVSGIVIHFTGWYVIDPIIGICIAIVIGWSTRSLLHESMRMSLDGVPEGIDYEQVKAAISGIDGVKNVHHLHIWPLSTTMNAMTTHVIINNPADMDRIINDIRTKMQQMGIRHSTIETETKVSSAEEAETDCCLEPVP